MDYPEEMQHNASSRAFWHSSHEPAHDVSYNALDMSCSNGVMSSMPPLDQACSTFLFPAASYGDTSPVVSPTSSHCPEFKSPYTEQCMLDVDDPGSGADLHQSRGGTGGGGGGQSYCAHTTAAGSVLQDPLQLSSWLSSPSSQRRDARLQVSAPQLHGERPYGGHHDGNNGESSLRPAGPGTSLYNPISAHDNIELRDPMIQFQDPGYQAFLKPFMRQPSLRRPDSGLQLVTKFNVGAGKASWQCTAPTDAANMSAASENHKPSSYKEALDSPCSVISGFTKVLQGAEPLMSSGDVYIESFGPSTSAAANHDLSKRLPTQESTLNAAGGGMSQSASRNPEAGGSQSHHARPKSKRTRTPKHGDEVESQRMTHIAVERNRRKQMNEHLAALRALMPGSYVQKGDQASIVGGAIEFVKELEHLLHCLQAQKRRRACSELSASAVGPSRPIPSQPDPLGPILPLQPAFSFHTAQGSADQSSFLLGSATPPPQRHPPPAAAFFPPPHHQLPPQQHQQLAAPGLAEPMGLRDIETLLMSGCEQTAAEAQSEAASVEVTLVGAAAAEAVLKVMWRRRRRGQLVRTVVAVESLGLSILHTNITTIHHTVLYSFHVMIGAKCRLNVEEIANTLHHTFSSIHSLQV